MTLIDRTSDHILKGKISVIQSKHSFRYGFDAVFLAAFVNNFLQDYKKKDALLADVGAGVGTISLIIAYKNEKIKLTAIENNFQYLELAKENVINNNFQKQIKLLNNDIFNINKDLINTFDLVVSNPPFYKNHKNRSKNELENYAKVIMNIEQWIVNSVKLLKDKGMIFLIITTEILDVVLHNLSKKTGSFKIFPFWPNSKSSSKRIILVAKKGGASPTELMSGLKLYNKKNVMTKKARLISEKGIFDYS
tara:strand:- start:37 stop:786 length:750 start_codon:yes stop_codon:yes gene_type:complete